MKERYINHDFFEIWYEDGIIFEVFKKDSVLDLALARIVVQERLKASGNTYSPIFIDIRHVFYTDTKARKYMASKEAVEYITAGALLLDNEIMKLAGNIFVKIDKPYIPTKLFTDETKAMQWLQAYKKTI